MKIGDLVVHIGAKPNGFRVRLVIDFDEEMHGGRRGLEKRATVIFVDGRYDWKDMWRVFNGWKGYEGWRRSKSKG